MLSFFKRRNEETSNCKKGKSAQSLPVSISDKLEMIREKTGNSPDVLYRTYTISEDSSIDLGVVYIDGIVEEERINRFMLKSVMEKREQINHLNQEGLFKFLKEEATALGSFKLENDEEQLFTSLMAGETIVFVDGLAPIIAVNTEGGETRQIEEPPSQVTIRGPRDGFTESLKTNFALVRRRIRNPNLWVESMKIGKQTKTKVAIMYVNGLANEKVVEEVRRRLNEIDVDRILGSGYIEQLVEDETMTPFPTVFYTERPDSVAGNLLEGRVAIFIDGTPFVLVAPVVFMQFLQTAEDYYTRFDIATALRFLRVFMLFLAILAPAIYIAVTTYHQEMIPTELLIVISAQRESVPFPAFIEALMMEVAFEILREASVRMPRAIGNAITIVGALVIGQVAVQAGVVSPAMIIVVAITAVASFGIPSPALATSVRLIRFIFMVAAATYGFYGVLLGLIALTVHLCSIRSFGVPYMAPIAPLIPSNLQDTIVRAPLWKMKQRPWLIGKGNNVRVGEDQKPAPPRSRTIINKEMKRDDQDET